MSCRALFKLRNPRNDSGLQACLVFISQAEAQPYSIISNNRSLPYTVQGQVSSDVRWRGGNGVSGKN